MGVMTTLVLNYTVNPFWTALKAFGRGVWNFGESMGRARAAAELSRQGYHEAARNVMLGK
jgi:hypothetical protein